MSTRAFCLAVAIGLVAWSSPAFADTITFNLDYEFSGGADPVGATPWMTITIDDSFGGPNTVRLTMDAVNLTGGVSGESVKGVYLNFDPLLDVTQLTFTAVDNSASIPNAVSAGTNAFKADGDGFFDIYFDFPPPPGDDSARFTGGEQVIYDLTFTAPISASSFDHQSVMGGGNGTYSVAAHIQRINGTDSGWVGPIPEPGTAVLLGLGMVGLGLYRKR